MTAFNQTALKIVDQLDTINDQESLTMINRAIIARMREISRKATRKFQVGDQVEFTNSRTGMALQGQIMKINQKTIIVQTLTGRWKVQAASLRNIVG